jgi:predicted Zn finger-like uncharacterized protein
MFTVCPKCALTLVVTAADLRVAQGYVRCGRCSNVFNALAGLTDERQPSGPAGETAAPAATLETPAAAAAAEPPAPETVTVAGAGSVGDEPIPEDALEFDPAKTDVTAVFVEPPPNPQWAAATGSFKAMIAANQEPAQPATSDAAADVEIDAAFLSSLLQREAANAEPPRAPEAAAPVRAAAPQRPSARPAQPAHGILSPAARGDLADDEDADARHSDDEPGLLDRLRPYAWHVGAAVATLLLLAQIVNHYRDELAATARFNRPLTALYAALHIPLTPHWDLRAYDVRQLGAAVDAAGSGLITVRASVKNAAQQPLPLPLLRVTLQDRFGNRIAARDVAPRSYLPHIAPASQLAGGQRVDAEMAFVDPGTNAVGFEIDACLPASGGGVACANDLSPR